VFSDKDLDLGTIRLERPLEFHVEYIVAENPATTFNPEALQKATFPAGKKWKSGHGNEWDLEFLQKDGTVTFRYTYGPCTMADLGDGRLADFLETDFNAAKLDPARVPFTSGHVCLLNHQRSLQRVVLFRVEVGGVQQKSKEQPAQNHPPKDSDPELRKLLTQRRDTLKSLAEMTAARLMTAEFRDAASPGQLVAVKHELLRAGLALAVTKGARILLLMQVLEDQAISLHQSNNPDAVCFVRWRASAAHTEEVSESRWTLQSGRPTPAGHSRKSHATWPNVISGCSSMAS